MYLYLAVLSIFSSVLQTAGVAAISVFFTVLLGGQLPGKAQEIVDSSSFLTLGIIVFLISISGTISSGISTYWGITISWEQYRIIAGRILRTYLGSSYEWHMRQNSADLINAVLTEASAAVSKVFQQVVLIAVRGAEILLMAILLFAARPLVAIVTFISFAITYLILYRYNRLSIQRYGKILVESNADRQKSVSEALGGIKSVLVADKAEFFLKNFNTSADRFSKAASRIQHLSMMPKYFIEGILLGGLIGFVVVSAERHWGVNESIPLLALYGAAAIRVLPAAQQLYMSVSTISSAKAVLDRLLLDLSRHSDASSRPHPIQATVLEDGVLAELRDVEYQYPGADSVSLKGVSLKIRQGDKIGLVGTTGAGKTTTIDLLLGLLKPTRGSVVVSDTLANVDNFVAYVPQHLFFLDDTIAANIAWGEVSEERDRTRIEAAAQKALIHDHIESLPEGYQTRMGERGVRFSGGQLQRIGIARALYSEPALLILDEASNALDPETEQIVLENLLEQDLTVVVIAHRISTLKNCSRIVVVQHGEVIADGRYVDLVETCPVFRRLAAADVGEYVDATLAV